MTFYDVIRKKRDGRELTEEEIALFVRGATDGSIPDYQLSALLMAIYFRGMTDEETATLTELIAESGQTLELSAIPGRHIDKHGTGGVGDKTSLIIGPIVAAAGMGVYLPKMAGRGLGFTGGTLDKLESCPGVSTEISAERFIGITRDIGFCIAGQSRLFAPAEARLSSLRDVTGTEGAPPLIASGIMGRKLAGGCECIFLDVKYGSGSFCKSERAAEELARTMVRIGASENRKTVALITDMNAPLGVAVGNSVEMIEAIEVLKGSGDEFLTDFCVSVAGRMLYTANAGDLEYCTRRARSTIDDGSALEKLAALASALGGDKKYVYDPSLFPESNVTAMLASDRSGYITAVDAMEVGVSAALLGAGRQTLGAAIDHTAGIVFNKRIGDRIEAGEALATLMAGDIEHAQTAMEHLYMAVSIGDEPPKKRKTPIKRIIG